MLQFDTEYLSSLFLAAPPRLQRQPACLAILATILIDKRAMHAGPQPHIREGDSLHALAPTCARPLVSPAPAPARARPRRPWLLQRGRVVAVQAIQTPLQRPHETLEIVAGDHCEAREAAAKLIELVRAPLLPAFDEEVLHLLLSLLVQPLEAYLRARLLVFEELPQPRLLGAQVLVEAVRVGPLEDPPALHHLLHGVGDELELRDRGLLELAHGAERILRRAQQLVLRLGPGLLMRSPALVEMGVPLQGFLGHLALLRLLVVLPLSLRRLEPVAGVKAPSPLPVFGPRPKAEPAELELAWSRADHVHAPLVLLDRSLALRAGL
mmetsp:Transcript_40867/g.130533  ORF Transcript_40867/g.130533 Transcript_40867/m.130533 type:complete len:324 (+) Transcript_40867:990-1961(+)